MRPLHEALSDSMDLAKAVVELRFFGGLRMDSDRHLGVSLTTVKPSGATRAGYRRARHQVLRNVLSEPRSGAPRAALLLRVRDTARRVQAA